MCSQLSFQLIEEEPVDSLPVWKRKPNNHECTYEFRQAEAPNENDEERWSVYRTYLLTKSDHRRGITDTDVKNIKRLMIEELSGESQGRSSERYWDYTACFRVEDHLLTCWLE
jgi:hypothetical protein